MANTTIQSVKFKRDYMMFWAFLLFFLIVTTECFLVVWLPWHLKLDSMWAEHVTRQELVDQFDGVRGRTRHIAIKYEAPYNAEGMVICRSLDRMAAALHQNNKYLTSEQCRPAMEVLQRLFGFSDQLVYRKKTFSAEADLNIDKYISSLRALKSDSEDENKK